MTVQGVELPSALRSMAETLIQLATTLDPNGSSSSITAKATLRAIDEAGGLLSSIAQDELASRRARYRYLKAELLGEPVWDILLDLFVHKVTGRLCSIKSASIASGTPPTTALRYFDVLEQAGLIVREKSKTDARVTYLSLTPDGYQRIGAILQ